MKFILELINKLHSCEIVNPLQWKLNSERLTVRFGWTEIYYSSPQPYGQPFWVQFLQASHCICWSEPNRFRYFWFVRWPFLELKVPLQWLRHAWWNARRARLKLASYADVLRLVTRSSPRTSAQRTGHFRSLAVSHCFKRTNLLFW